MSATPPPPTLTADRRRQYAEMIASSTTWASTQDDVAALGLAGSWARDAATMASDVDLLVLTDRCDMYASTSDWIEPATGSPGRIVRTQAWGPLTERRVQLASGLVVECGFAPRSWADVQPLDDGTARVVADGFAVLYDPFGLLDRLVAAVAAP